jgi:hypothetical protein
MAGAVATCNGLSCVGPMTPKLHASVISICDVDPVIIDENAKRPIELV